MTAAPKPYAAPPRFFFERKVADHMVTKVISISPDATLRDASKIFDKHDFNSLPVLDGDKLVGLVSKFDFMHAFAFTEAHPIPDYQALMDTPVRKFMRAEELLTVPSDKPLTRVLQKMVETRTRSFPVVDDGKLVGIISREDIIHALRESTGL